MVINYPLVTDHEVEMNKIKTKVKLVDNVKANF